MDIHKRYLCRECKREWIDPTYWYANSSPVTISGNPKSIKNCPICGSPEVDLVEYKPSEPGLDIPRDSSDLKIVSVEIVSQIETTDRHRNEAVKVFGDRKPHEMIIPPVIAAEERKNVALLIENDSVYDLSEMD